MYSLLQSEAFVLSKGGVSCKPPQLIAIFHLSFDPSLYIPEELLFAATGYRYPHEMLTGCLNSERAILLHMEKFQVNTIVICMEYLAAHWAGENSAMSHERPLQQLCGLLLCLDLVASSGLPEGSSRRPQGHLSDSRSQMIPVQAMKKMSKGFQSSTVGSSRLPLQVIGKLRKLKIWPLSSGTFISLDKDVLFVNPVGGLSKSFSVSQTNCLQMFQEGHLLMLCEELFAAAALMGKDFDRRIRAFLLRNFESSAAVPGGIEELTAQKVIKTIILPAYSSIKLPGEIESKTATDSDNGNSNEVFKSPITRETAAAYLAFLYTSFGHEIAGGGKPSAIVLEMTHTLKEHGVIVPVRTAREVPRKQTLKWEASDQNPCQRVKSSPVEPPSREIHLGVEIRDSSTCQLALLPISTALRQLTWSIVDPLVACLIFSDKKQNLVGKLRVSSLLHEDICHMFSSAAIPNVEWDYWKAFLNVLGVVDFFDVYNVGTSTEVSMKAPHLLKVLNHLVQHGVPVCTQRDSDDLPTCSDDDNGDHATEVLYVPVFLPSMVLRPVLSISQDIHFSLKVRAMQGVL